MLTTPQPRRQSADIAICLMVDAGFMSGASAQQRSVARLGYDAMTHGAAPIPSGERALKTVVAERWFKVSDENRILEGAIFDRSGKLLFCDVTGRGVLPLTPDKQLSIVVTLDPLSPGILAFHLDERLFIAALDIPNGCLVVS